jgi:hypothetical protein
MRDPVELRALARLIDTSLGPGVNKQIWLWAAELAEMAEEVEQSSEDGPAEELVILKHWRDP